MHLIKLLGQYLKSDSVIEFLESFDMEVVYNFDRTNEGLFDEYYSTSEEHGIELQFNDEQKLETIFLTCLDTETFRKHSFVDGDLDFPVFRTCEKAKSEFESLNVEHKFKESKWVKCFPNVGHTPWLKGFNDAGYIHYQFNIDGLLKRICLHNP
ncbi:MAG TPA: hypothetical protein DEO86_03755 [Colwellia sp.]|nr:hypothetical protein [Colwellia sp.]|tara:strand:+ start:931 stop:1392 length:462 start_codon:yes stop_codon:yes gene_type:complete